MYSFDDESQARLEFRGFPCSGCGYASYCETLDNRGCFLLLAVARIELRLWSPLRLSTRTTIDGAVRYQPPVGARTRKYLSSTGLWALTVLRRILQPPCQTNIKLKWSFCIPKNLVVLSRQSDKLSAHYLSINIKHKVPNRSSLLSKSFSWAALVDDLLRHRDWYGTESGAKEEMLLLLHPRMAIALLAAVV